MRPEKIGNCKQQGMTLRAQLLDSTLALLDQLPGVRDGNVDAVHDARVATRRMRALLPILSVCYPHIDLKSTARTVKKAGRALGRVRDLDVAIELIGELERTSPAVAERAAEVRRSIAAKQLTARRRLVKEFDGLPLGALKSVAAHLPAGPAGPFRARACGNATVRSATRCASRRRHSGRRSSTAPGCTFRSGRTPSASTRRSSATCSRWRTIRTAIAPDGLKILKKSQEILGRLHDREVLRERFARLAVNDEDDASSRRHWPRLTGNASSFSPPT